MSTDPQKDTSLYELKMSFYPPFLFVLLMWLVMLFQFVTPFNLNEFGIYPRSISGLVGIITSPLLHGSFSHLFSNTFPIMILGTAMFYFYPKRAPQNMMIMYLVSGAIIWMVGRESFHIGASTLVYGFASYIFFIGMFRSDIKSLALSMLTVFFYGSMIWGVLPIDHHISWEGHLAGAFLGVLLAYRDKDEDPPPQPTFEDDNEYEHLNYKNIHRYKL